MSHAAKAEVMPEDYEDLIYRVTYFFLGKVAHWIPRRVSPNQITVAAFVSALIGCLLLYVVPGPAGYLWWVAFNLLWYVLDALDGIHARLTGQCSELGGFLDHFFDTIYFIFMFAVFAVRFDLFAPLYIFILLLRTTAATSVFLVQVHTGRLVLGKFSGGFELLLMSSVMVLSYLYPHLDLTTAVSQPWLQTLAGALSLESGVFMKLTLLIYLVGVPINFVLQYRFVKKTLAS